MQRLDLSKMNEKMHESHFWEHWWMEMAEMAILGAVLSKVVADESVAQALDDFRVAGMKLSEAYDKAYEKTD